MRVTTGMIYDLGVASIQHRQQEQIRLQQQVASGLRILKPSDDPVAAATALDVTQAQRLNERYQSNAEGAKSLLSLEESALADATRLLQDARTLAVYAGNPTLSNADKVSVAAELDSLYQEMLGIANRTDGNGLYLFSGYQGTTRPFAESAPGSVIYAGDAGERRLEVSASRALKVSDSGDSIFRAIRNGNGTFATAPGTANAGSGIVGPGTVTDALLWNGPGNSGDFSIRFHVDSTVTPPVRTYDIVDNTANVSLTTGAAPGAGPYLRGYTPGATIDLARRAPPDTNPAPFDFGATLTIEGAPASGDVFTVKASVDQDVFTTLHGLVAALRTGVTGGAASGAVYQNALNAALSDVDNALNRVLTVRAEVGTRLKEIDVALATGEDLSLQYVERLSRLQDLDYAKALSDVSLQQVYLEAAQKSFLTVSSLDLFKLI